MVKKVSDFSVSREKNDLGFITFDLKADMNPLFNWNVKQLFLYLTAEYETDNNKVNQVVLWDKIIQRGEKAVIDLNSMNTKYYFFDDGNGLRSNKNVTLSLAWNVIPNAGTLPKVNGDGGYTFEFPTEYSSSRS
ncbi:Signal peptidase complex subunit 3 [Lamellibrachia satsuma]|nr:Signal peptidase complex subunit 3 [Lamellibrachia satsuma]